MKLKNTINRMLYGENVDAIPAAILAVLFVLLVSFPYAIYVCSRYQIMISDFLIPRSIFIGRT